MGSEEASQSIVFTKQPGRGATSTFVGREPELAALRAALEDAVGGCGSVVFLGGEPGIGKTRTADEFSTYAGEHGAQVLWGLPRLRSP